MSVEGAVRMVVDRMRARCPACGGRILVSYGQSPMAAEIRLVAMCHGSVDRYTITGEAIRGRDERAIDRLARWARDLFKLDASPDMMELLSYNQGKLPERRA